MKRIFILFIALGFLLGGCGRRAKEITSLQRKEAETLASEADFAMTLRDLPRTESLLTKVVALCPDNGEYWVNLGAVRMRLGEREKAKTAYQSALAAYKDAAKLEPLNTERILQQVYILALLGRVDEARKLVEQTQKKFPEDRFVREFVQEKQFDRMLAERNFKEVSL
ncbi:MAG TPA: tetratricopeptide repeat protein [Opitutaceae bacterium]|nr:tetratricopeptide repeat protein [Opitutaceae bacterium]